MSKNILITSIPCWNQKSGSDTLSSLFKEFAPETLANIYILSGTPDSMVCSRYFNIHEWQVVKSVFKRNIATGHEVFVTNGNDLSSNVNKDFSPKSKIAIKRRRIFLWIRELAWMFGKWNSRELKDFIEDFDPEILVFPIESYPYFNRINEYIIKTFRPKKVIGYLWDDNFTYKQRPKSLIYNLERFFLRRQISRLVSLCTNVIAISPKMKKECDEEFGIQSTVITKPILNTFPFKPYSISTPINILYTGKLIIGRDQALLSLVETLEKSGYKSDQIHINVYTNTILSNVLIRRFDESPYCTIHSAVPQDEVFRLQQEADILLFLESLSDKDLTARLSFSTKLTDYFAAGKCIWAIGNSGLGPIEYLRSENAGIVSCNIEEIADALSQIINDKNCISDYAQKSYDCGKRNHNYDIITKKLRALIN